MAYVDKQQMILELGSTLMYYVLLNNMSTMQSVKPVTLDQKFHLMNLKASTLRRMMVVLKELLHSERQAYEKEC